MVTMDRAGEIREALGQFFDVLCEGHAAYQARWKPCIEGVVAEGTLLWNVKLWGSPPERRFRSQPQ